MGKFDGSVPIDRYRCTTIRKCGVRCRKWRVRGSNKCRSHGGKYYRSGASMVCSLKGIPVFYSKYLSSTLEELVEEQLGTDPRETLNLFEELALVRITAGQAIKLFSATEQLPDPGDDEKKMREQMQLKQNAAVLMQDALRQVQSMCESAARVEAAGKDKYSIHSLKAVIAQIIRIMYRVCGKEHQAIAESFESLVKSEIRMPTEVEGTTLTPDADVMDMDGSVPLLIEQDECSSPSSPSPETT